jgi:hypothetical protein
VTQVTDISGYYHVRTISLAVHPEGLKLMLNEMHDRAYRLVQIVPRLDDLMVVFEKQV